MGEQWLKNIQQFERCQQFKWKEAIIETLKVEWEQKSLMMK